MSILIYTLMLFPLIGSLVIFTMPKSRSELFRPIAIFLSIIPFGLCLYLFTNSQSKGSFVNIHTIDWIKSYGIDIKGHIMDTMVMSSLIDENHTGISYPANETVFALDLLCN